ncbi:MAG: hypothetical protein HBSAPP03_24190 [Phycisphaerae bacterium]|nr:MAG: hypothetical protein HBSAPP03_24190 [Phycisphaerae bacterium]
MRDDHLLNLVRMAREADELERGMPLALVGEVAPRRRVWAPLLAIASMAAAVTLAWVLWPAPPLNLPSPPAPGPIALQPMPRTDMTADGGARVIAASTESTIDACEPSGPMLLAVFHQTDERCDCVVWRPGAFVEYDIARLGSADLIQAAWDNRCADTSELVLVLAIDGPRELLPADADAALELAATLSIPRAWCGEDPACYEDSAAGLFPSSVRVVAETLALSSR